MRPNGHKTKAERRKEAMPNGMVMMSTHITRPAIAYPRASQMPERKSQIRLRKRRTDRVSHGVLGSPWDSEPAI